jgi:hypothetical protein
MTKRAQALNAEIIRSFPRMIKLSNITPAVQVRLDATLAQSLEVLPRKLLQHTFRTDSFNKQLRCDSSSVIACSNTNCPLDVMSGFINSGACPRSGCSKTCETVLKSTEQELVDTMMVADLIHLAGRGEMEVGIVSSDDDMWPGSSESCPMTAPWKTSSITFTSWTKYGEGGKMFGWMAPSRRTK